MLNIYRVDHIGQIVPELEPQVALLEGLFGFRRSRSWENIGDGCRGVLFDVPGSWGHRWEILAPLGKDSPVQTLLDSRGPGLHHVAVEVPNIDAAIEQMERVGMSAKRRRPDPSGRWIDVPFVPPERETGLLFRVFGPPLRGTCGDDAVPRKAAEGSAAAQPAPSLGIVAIEQVGHAYWDREQLARWCERALGMHEVYRTPEGKHPDIATLVLTIPGTQMRWEIIQPVGENAFVQRFLDKRGAESHHVTFEVRDWDRALAACAHHQIPTFGENEGTTDGFRWRDTFIHPRHTGGILVQFFWEEHPGVWSRSDKIPWTAQQTAAVS